MASSTGFRGAKVGQLSNQALCLAVYMTLFSCHPYICQMETATEDTHLLMTCADSLASNSYRLNPVSCTNPSQRL